MKMKLVLITSTFLSLLLLVTMVMDRNEIKKFNDDNQDEKITINFEEVKELANFTALEVTYHTVAKYDKETSKKFIFLEKSIFKKLWIEYDVEAEIGIDLSYLNIEVDDNNLVKVTIPYAKVMDCNPKDQSIAEGKVYIDVDSDKITIEDQKEAINNDAEKIVERINQDNYLLNLAYMRTKEAIENYINSIGELTQTQYQIQWIELDANGNELPTK